MIANSECKDLHGRDHSEAVDSLFKYACSFELILACQLKTETITIWYHALSAMKYI